MVIGCIYMATLAPHGDEYLQGQDSALDNKDTRRSEEIMNPFATECPQCPLDVDRFLAAVFDVLMMSRDGDNWEHSGNYQGHNKLGRTTYCFITFNKYFKYVRYLQKVSIN